MVDAKKPSSSAKKDASTLLAVTLAGALTATATIALLQTGDRQSTVLPVANPVLLQTLKKVEKLQKSGEWKKSADLLKPFATPENPQALLDYAKLLSRGWGVLRNLDKAREKLLLAVQQEFPNRGEAAFELAKVYRQSSGEDCARIAFEWFSKAADWGVSKAHSELGRHHARGIGVPVDMQRALSEYQAASKQGSASALLSFLQLASRDGDLGKGLPPLDQLIGEAVTLLEHEAMQGKAESAKALGHLYLGGALSERDDEKAKTWFLRGANLGDSGAMTELALIMIKGKPTTAVVDDALTLMKRAVKMNNAGALTEFGRLHLNQRFGLEKKGAVKLFEKGIKAAHPGSMVEMARLLLSGDIVVQDKARARRLLERGAALGHVGSTGLLRKISTVKSDIQTISQSGRLSPSSEIKKPSRRSILNPKNDTLDSTPSERKG